MSWYTAFLRKHNPVLEIGHLSLVHLRSVEVWDRAFLRVWDLWAMRNGFFFPESVSDPVIESFRDVRDLEI